MIDTKTDTNTVLVKYVQNAPPPFVCKNDMHKYIIFLRKYWYQKFQNKNNNTDTKHDTIHYCDMIYTSTRYLFMYTQFEDQLN